jgi:hypothetical protein
MNNTAVLLCTYHKTFSGGWHDNILKFYAQNFPNFQILFDNQTALTNHEISLKYNGIPVTTFGDADFDNYNFNRPISRMHRWGAHQNPKYFYAHFRMMCYYIQNPHHKYYWFFDDDVEFEGDVKGLLTGYESCEDDFIAIQVFKKEVYTGFDRVSIASNRMKGSGGHWLGFAPGPGDNYKSINRHMGSFFPIVRFSNRAMCHLNLLNKEGFYGYSEGFVPTSLASDGFTVSSMLDENDNFFIQPTVDCILKHKSTEFTWSWI